MRDSPPHNFEPEALALTRQLASLYTRWRQPLARMLRRYFDTPEAVEDAAQEVFARIASAGKVLPAGQERPYLHQAARSMAGDAWRKHPGRHGVQVVSAADCEDELHDIAGGDGGSTERAAEHRQRLARLHAAIAELPERQRQAFVLHRVQGHTVEETAQSMGISVRMVVKHLSRGLSYCQARIHYADADQMRALHAQRSLDADDADAARP